MKTKITYEEIRDYMDIETPEFPKYMKPLINLANRFAQGTRPRVVGQMSDLIQHFTGKSLSEWEKWYSEQKPEAIKEATEKIVLKLNDLRNTLNKIDQAVVEKWVRDLVIVKTFVGLRFQEAILKRLAETKNTTYRLSEPDEESQGVDGYLGNTPVSIKPHTYKSEDSLSEHIQVKIIYYKKLDDGLEVDYAEIQ
jgi:uncharacterized protein YukE